VRKQRKTNQIFYRTNWQIRADKVRLLDENSKQVGVFTLAEARERARKEGVDLVEIASQAKPPVVKLINFDKFKYQQNKKRKKEVQSQKGGIKEIRCTPFIGEADLEVRLSRMKKFLTANNRVKFVVKFLGRQIVNKDFGHQIVGRVAEKIKDFGEQESEPKLMGKRLIVFFKPVKLVRNENKDEKKDKKVGKKQI
jgi:translation initiation factor IF-3